MGELLGASTARTSSPWVTHPKVTQVPVVIPFTHLLSSLPCDFQLRYPVC